MALWHVVIFTLYLAWDVVTKIAMYPKPAGASWFRGWGQLDSKALKEQKQTTKRAGPTVACLVLSILLWWLFAASDVKHEHLVAADLALWSVVLLFRALKGVIPGPKQTEANMARNRRWAAAFSVTFVVGTYLAVYSIPLPLWQSFEEIRMPITEAQP